VTGAELVIDGGFIATKPAGAQQLAAGLDAFSE
jgi:hypothetical protein